MAEKPQQWYAMHGAETRKEKKTTNKVDLNY
jgi:hypothetical protein